MFQFRAVVSKRVHAHSSFESFTYECDAASTREVPWIRLTEQGGMSEAHLSQNDFRLDAKE
jgi:hypothetical protein